MIIRFCIENFGPVKEKQELSFEAGRTAHLAEQYVHTTTNGLRILKLLLIYGANASGKSTILKALDFLRHLVLEPATKKTTPLAFQTFLFDEQTPTLPSYLSIDFLQHDIRYHYEVGFNQQCILAERLYAINPRKSLIFERTTDTTGELARITFGKKVKVSRVAEQAISVNTLWNNTVLGGYLKTNVEITELKGVTDWFNDYLNMTVNRKTDLIKHVYAQIKNGRLPKQQLANLMNRADLSITDIHLREREETPQERLMGLMDNAGGNLQLVMEEPAHWGSTKTVEIELEHKVESGSYSLPFEAESEGTRRYFGIAGLILLLAQYPCCFPIDELEDSLHPDLYEHFLLLFLMNAKASQMIATTHNREILNERDLFRNDAIYFVDKNAAGAAEVFSLADFDTSAVRDSTNVLTAYKVGKLGGRPNLGDYYIDVAP